MTTKLALTEINVHVFLGRPQETPANTGNAYGPSLILLFGYMDARAAHLQKYVDNLHAQFPAATIVLIKSFSNFFWCSNKYLETVLMPVVEILKNGAAATQNSLGILVHILSNGGGFNYMTFHRLLEKLATPGILLDKGTPSALILDSTPGDNGLASAISFVAPSNPLLRLFAVPPVALLYGIFYAINTINGNTPMFDQLRSTLLSPNILPTVLDSQSKVSTTPRIYIYSKIDKIAEPAKIRAHLEESQRMGFDVGVEMYDNTAHVGHAHKDPERYWSAVRGVWEKAADRKRLMMSLL
ncbi:hypothetical protein C8J57DRAFT_1288425 [Mycena rebaudengoi]|nr:hypothetical protein C8J57DRAFT_1288425 [Mycena rebaudengoi]